MSEREEHIQGRRGGSAEPYVNPPYAVVEPSERGLFLKDRVRWSSVWAGLVVAFATQLILAALVFAIFLTMNRTGVTAPEARNLGIWTAITALIALFLGGWTAARLAGVAGRLNGVWNGVVVWALTLTLGSLAASLGIGGVLGYTGGLPAGPLAGGTARSLPELLSNAANGAWWFFIGAIIGLIAAALGGYLGARPDIVVEGEPRATV